MTRGAWATYLLGMGLFASVIAAVTWAITNAIGTTEHTKLVLTTQAPIVAILILWVIALIAGRKQ